MGYVKARAICCDAGRILHSILLLTIFLRVHTQDCPEVFGDFENSTYCLYHSKETFENARSYCQSLGGNLTIILSSEQNEFLSAGVKEHGIEHGKYWIGLEWFKNNHSMYYAWIDGDPVSMNLHWQNNTAPHVSGKCGFMFGLNTSSPGKWGLSPCEDSRTSICQFTNALPLGSWAPLGDQLYFVSPAWTARTYDDARTYCQNIGGDLAQPRTKMIHYLLKGASGTDGMWIGLRGRSPQNGFEWVDGTTLGDGYMPWLNNGTIEETCAYLYEKAWNILSCTALLKFACETNRALPVGSWVPFTNAIYFKSPSWLLLSFHDARNYCQGFGGDLVQPKNEETHNFLRETTDANVWLGLSYNHSESEWIDITTQGQSYPAWAPSPIQVHDDNGCVSLTENDNWVVQSCSTELGFTCEIACPHGRWDPPSCLGLCDNCFNGGICHQEYGTCICPPGFSGKNCLEACGEHMYGLQCERVCGSGHDLKQCAGSQVCLPDPYGSICSCLSGYTGTHCNETCEAGTFGVDCLQDCHCSLGSSCDPYTGNCSTECEDGWSGPSCQVPDVCTIGFFGRNCTEKCNCLDGLPCDKESGACRASKGECAIGYIPDTKQPFDNCRQFSGCYNTCLGTCHCSGGAPDCNSTNGSCFSNKCSLRWTGEKCQRDRFTIEVERTNPGLASFNCSFSTVGLGEQFPVCGGINLARNDTLINRTVATVNDTTIGILSMSFWIENISSDEILYCTFDYDLSFQRPIIYARIPEREFYVLPQLNSTPNISDIGAQHLTLQWRRWDPDIDAGDGPIVGYAIYIRTRADDQLRQRETISFPSFTFSSSRPRRQLTEEMISHNITDLQADTPYSLGISVMREGIGGEGPEGARINVRTKSMSPTTPTTLTTTDTSSVSQTTIISKAASVNAGIVGGIVAFLAVLLVVIIVIFILKQRRKHKSTGEEESGLQMSPASFGDNGLEEITSHEYDGQDKSVPDSVSPETVPLQSSQQDATPNMPVKRTSTLSEGRPVAEVSPMTRRGPIPVAEFPVFVHKNRYTSFFSDEFEALPKGNLFPQSVAGLAINYDKNRYKNVLPYDATRVILNIINDDPTTDYYNASYILNFKDKRAYIACQGPNKASIDDFWRMVWQENVRTIAVVTNLKEGNTIKCRQYWPNVTNQTVSFGLIDVKLASVKDCTGWVVRHLVLQQGNEARGIRQFHFTKWPDKGVPRHTSSLLNFLREVQADHGQTEAPLLIHCSAGVGRSGVVIGIDGIIAESKATGLVDVFNFVSKMRQNRPYMVQTDEQYEFLHDAVLEELLWKDTSIPVAHFSSHLGFLQESDSGDKQTRLSKEFENLQLMCPAPPQTMYRSGLMPANLPKNRYGNLLPLQRNRVMLRTQDTEEDYINASFVKAARYSYIVTAMPMSNTVSDFWAMIYDYNPSCIVMLNDENEDESCENYWPQEGTASYDAFTVSTSSTIRENDIIVRSLRVHHAESSTYHDVDQYQFLGWSEDTPYQDGGASSLLTLIDQVQESVDTEGYILVHCMSGVGRTGVFCTAMECIAQIPEGHTIDIFQTVKMLRADRTNFVQTKEDYAYVHTVLQEYLRRKNYEQVQIHCALNNELPYSNTEPDDLSNERPYDNTLHGTDNTALRGGPAENTTGSLPDTQSQAKDALYENVAFQKK